MIAKWGAKSLGAMIVIDERTRERDAARAENERLRELMHTIHELCHESENPKKAILASTK